MKKCRLARITLFEESRKVGFGIWIFCASCCFLMFGKITAGDWVGCVSMASILIGGGTVADTWMNVKNDSPHSEKPK